MNQIKESKINGEDKMKILQMGKTASRQAVFLLLLFIVSVMQMCSVYAGSNEAGGISLSLVSHDPDPAVAGDVVEARIGVMNLGGQAISNLTLEIVSEYPFTLASGQDTVQSIGTIAGYQGLYDSNTRIVKYKLIVNKDATAGTYNLKIRYYVTESSAWIEKSLSIDVTNRESAEIIHIDQTMLTPGKISPLKFTINNVGNAPLRDFTFYWQNTDNIILPVGSDNTKYIKYIDVGESAELDYNVIADTAATPGLYKLNLYLTYDDPLKNGTKTISTIAGVYVGGGTDFDVAYSDNSNGQTSFTVANIGSNPAYSVSISIPEGQRGWRVTGSNSVIIGNLNKGDYTVASFSLQSQFSNRTSSGTARTSASNAGQARQFGGGQFDGNQFGGNQSMNASDTVLVQIAYTDTAGERTIVDKQVKIGSQNLGSSRLTTARGTTTQQSFLSKYFPYIAILIVLVAGYLIYRRYKSQKTLNPNFKIKDLFRRKKKQK